MEEELLRKAYLKYNKELYLYALSLCKNEELAKDLVSETFYKALLTLNKPCDNLKYWLFRVLKNLFIDQGRNNKKYTPLDDYIPFIYSNDSPLKNLLQEEREIKVYEKVTSLTPTTYKEVITLYYYGGLNIKEIADTLESSPNTIKITLYRARKKLRKSMKEDSYEF